MINELKNAYNHGITIICDLTAYTQPYNYYRVIQESPVKIVSCVGFYTPRYVPNSYRKMDSSRLVKVLSKKVESGIGSNKIKPGILKVASNSERLSEEEEKYFYIVATLNKEYDLPIAVHAPNNAYEHVCQLVDYGANPKKIFVAHIETGVSNPVEFEKRTETAQRIMKLGSFVQLADFGCISDSKKSKSCVSFANNLITSGFFSQMLLSGDSCWKWKNSEFVVKEYNHANGKHYTYTTDFSLPLLKPAYFGKNTECSLLLKNPAQLWL